MSDIEILITALMLDRADFTLRVSAANHELCTADVCI
jgi:hypothetical protein